MYTSEAFGITKLFIEGDFGEVQWWQHTKPITFNPSDPDYKIPEWKDFNLEFDKKKEKPQNKNKNKKFKPTIIDGSSCTGLGSPRTRRAMNGKKPKGLTGAVTVAMR